MSMKQWIFEKRSRDLLPRSSDFEPCVQGNELIAELEVPKGPMVGKLVAEQVGNESPEIITATT